MSPVLPPIYRDCRRLLLHTEHVVARFSRYHKYTVGTDLRQQAMVLMRGVHQAVYDKANQLRHVQALVWRVDDYKLALQLAIKVGAFVHGKAGRAVQLKPGASAGAKAGAPPGFAAFELTAQLAAQIGKQCGGWQKAAEQKIAGNAATWANPAPSAAFSQTRAGQPAPKSASALRAQVGTQGPAPGAAGLQPVAPPLAHPASLSERTTPYGPKGFPMGQGVLA